MATAGIRISQASHDKLLRYVIEIQRKQEDFSDFRDKLETIDVAYAKHTEILPEDPNCTNRVGKKESESVIKVPIVSSETQTVAAYLAKVFINKVRLFPVVSPEGDAPAAMALQAIIAKDARYQRWGRQLLKFLNLAARYNVQGIEVENIYQKDTQVSNGEDVDTVQLDVTETSVTRLYTIDMYNALFDYRVEPADVTIDGEYVGYNKIVSKTWLKAYGNMLSTRKQGYNLKEAYESSMSGTEQYWHEKPDVTSVQQSSIENQEDWFNWIGILDDPIPRMTSSSYFITRLYVRIIPGEFKIGTSQHPVIIKLTVVNLSYIIEYEEILTPLNALPILFSDLEEDGFGYQTKSVGENVLPYQEAATELLATRMEGSKRAIADRAIYDPLWIDKNDVNSRTTAAKIPLKRKLTAAGPRAKLQDTYYQIPFEGQGVVNAVADLQLVLQLKDNLTGSNFLSRGQSLPGNRTLGEVDQLGESSDDKLVVKAIRVEEQVFTILKLILKSNILQSTIIEDKTFDPDTGKVSSATLQELRTAMLDFRIADGLKPKSAMRSPEVLSTALQFVQNSPELNQTHDVGGIFEDTMGVLDIDISKHRRQLGGIDGNTGGGTTPNTEENTTNTGTVSAGSGSA